MTAGPAAPGSWLGVLGGGQLGRMFVQAAQQLGFRVLVLDPDPHAPAAAAADERIVADYADPAALDALAARCVAVTTEFENVPAAALERVAARAFVAPAAVCVAVAQDRIAEKRFVESTGARLAPWAEIAQAGDLEAADQGLFPGLLKRVRLGYDGKGQAGVADPAAALRAFESFGGAPCVLERRVALAHEISVICVRGEDGECIAYPAFENRHRDGILAVTTMPAAGIDAATLEAARASAMRIAAALGYVGVLCVEFFIDRDGTLLVNEMAPRPHNSGHATIEAAIASQFEQQVRTLARLPLGSAQLARPAVMLNLLGDLWFDAHGAQREPDWSGVLRIAGASLHLYGKREPRRGRKMGHLTCCAASADGARAIAVQAAARLGLAL